MSSLRQTSSAQSGPGCLLTFLPVFFVLGLALMAIVFLGGVPWQEISRQAAPAVYSGTTKMASLYSPSVLRWSDDVLRWAEDYDLDPNLVATVMQIESCGNPRARSSAGAAGLFQVMPFHFSSGEDPVDPATNARRGLGYLKQSLEAAGGDVRLALAGYNGGIGVLSLPEYSWPAETRRYAEWGSRLYDEAARGEDTSRTLEDWLSSGGSALCRQAASKSAFWTGGE